MSESHWDSRAKLGVTYKGEKFYTITPLPFYVKRRAILLKLTQPFIDNSTNVCDLGCGDGWYLNYFSKTSGKGKYYLGVDISEQMIRSARASFPGLEFLHTVKGIPQGHTQNGFDLIYSFAVLAHVQEPHALESFIRNVKENLTINGKFIAFEQVAPYNYAGTTFTRRTMEEYRDLFLKQGFMLQSSCLISFPCHMFFERHIAKRYCQTFCKGNTDFERRVNANSHWVFRSLSSLFLLFDRKPMQYDASGGWGNCFMVFENHN